MKLLAAALKTARVVYREPALLAVLFLMPAVLVLVVALVQEDAFRAIEGIKTEMLVVDEDGGDVARAIEKGLTDTGHFVVIRSLGGKALTEGAAMRALTAGEYQVGLIIPKGSSERINQGADDLAAHAFSQQDEEEKKVAALPEIFLCFDPAIRGISQKVIVTGVRAVVYGVQMRLFVSSIQELTGQGEGPEGAPHELVAIRERVTGSGGRNIMPTSVQQNVPAWTLFAMFLIVIPVSNVIIRERTGGTLVRLRTLPVSSWTLLMGNIIVYVVLCLIQFVIILMIGLFVLPRLGTPKLDLNVNLAALAIVALASALAATGFGIMVASLARTNDMAGFFGATFTVIAAVLGGIMVPVFLMPPGMQAISHYSPLNWGLNAFLEIFLRGGGVAQVIPDVLRLTVFFAVTFTIAVICFKRRESSPGGSSTLWRTR